MSQSFKSRLLVFAKLPEPGRVKTRLIPALGEEGAADLHREMLLHTLAVCHNWQQFDQTNQSYSLLFARPSNSTLPESTDEVIRFLTSGDPSPTEPSSDFDCQFQSKGDLGDRLAAGFKLAFANGADRVIAIGTDCPELEPKHLSDAFERLERCEVVIGPSLDGGYYLIGMSNWLPLVFEKMPWSQPSLFEVTSKRLEASSITWQCLGELGDVDTPEDLPRWDRRKVY